MNFSNFLLKRLFSKFAIFIFVGQKIILKHYIINTKRIEVIHKFCNLKWICTEVSKIMRILYALDAC